MIAGRFECAEKVGVGGMGVVHRARDRQTDRLVALKLLEGRDASEIERARREADILARLAHPAIVSYVADGITEDGRLFLAMEWIDGITAARRIAGDGFTLRETIATAKRILGALAAAHALGVFHRDVKPTNVLLPDGDPERAMLIDFGIARVGDAVTSLTRTGMTLGTPGYMAPEQARGQKTLTSAIDVFGLACTLYEFATGVPAFSGTMPSAVLIKILVAEPVPLEQLCPEAPHALCAWLARMLRKDAGARTPDCARALEELEALGEVPDGPRRNSRHLTETPTPPASAAMHCLLVASRGTADAVMEATTPEEHDALDALARQHGARLEFCATNGILLHVIDDASRAMQRAAQLALEVRQILPRWSIALASNADVTTAADRGTTALAEVAMADLFGHTASIVVDRSSIPLLEDLFELQIGKSPRLIGRK